MLNNPFISITNWIILPDLILSVQWTIWFGPDHLFIMEVQSHDKMLDGGGTIFYNFLIGNTSLCPQRWDFAWHWLNQFISLTEEDDLGLPGASYLKAALPLGVFCHALKVQWHHQEVTSLCQGHCWGHSSLQTKLYGKRNTVCPKAGISPSGLPDTMTSLQVGNIAHDLHVSGWGFSHQELPTKVGVPPPGTWEP